MTCESLRTELTEIKNTYGSSTRAHKHLEGAIEELETTCPESESAKTHTAHILKTLGHQREFTDKNPPLVRRQALDTAKIVKKMYSK